MNSEYSEEEIKLYLIFYPRSLRLCVCITHTHTILNLILLQLFSVVIKMPLYIRAEILFGMEFTVKVYYYQVDPYISTFLSKVFTAVLLKIKEFNQLQLNQTTCMSTLH